MLFLWFLIWLSDVYKLGINDSYVVMKYFIYNLLNNIKLIWNVNWVSIKF